MCCGREKEGRGTMAPSWINPVWSTDRWCSCLSLSVEGGVRCLGPSESMLNTFIHEFGIFLIQSEEKRTGTNRQRDGCRTVQGPHIYHWCFSSCVCMCTMVREKHIHRKKGPCRSVGWSIEMVLQANECSASFSSIFFFPDGRAIFGHPISTLFWKHRQTDQPRAVLWFILVFHCYAIVWWYHGIMPSVSRWLVSGCRPIVPPATFHRLHSLLLTKQVSIGWKTEKKQRRARGKNKKKNAKTYRAQAH
jgi:hypothetical protein